MVKQMNDLPEINTEETLAHKLRTARDNTSLSRAKVQAETGISAKSLEKYEDGSSEPPLSRLKTLCALYDLPLHELLGEEKTAGNQDLVNIPGTSEVLSEESPEEVTEDMLSVVREMLKQLDDNHSTNFKAVTRQSLAQTSDLQKIMKHLEVDELLQLATERGLFVDECPDRDTLFGVFEASIDEGQSLCCDIGERLIDTAVLGVDLHAIDRDALASFIDDLSEDFEIESEVFFGWGKHNDFVPNIRGPLRQLAFTGKPIDFKDQERFPARQ
ncbi:helix-turn-helix domain-containing protein [Kiloniella antarctica]|uniref:Helix-turn-helix domain-containing protein n=1 Tax=Kiloniella antarctica TaxID=1550907 RepID=A0ABW5BEZ5_9PROT